MNVGQLHDVGVYLENTDLGRQIVERVLNVAVDLIGDVSVHQPVWHFYSFDVVGVAGPFHPVGNHLKAGNLVHIETNNLFETSAGHEIQASERVLAP